MKKLLNLSKNPKIFILLCFLAWEIYLFLIVAFSPVILRTGYLGVTPWFNFDGAHYIEIVKFGYFNYVQAFFPLFPLSIKGLSYLLDNNYIFSTFVIVYFFALLSIFMLWKLVRLDFPVKIASWTIIFLFFFPSSFFLLSAYTEALFLFLVLTSFYFARKKKFLIASILASLAAATRIVGIFLLPAIIWEIYKNKKKDFRAYITALLVAPVGLLSYMFYLWDKFGDPLLFINVQPGFGAGRSGGEIILLPQVFYRYFKILTTISYNNFVFWISFLEITIFIFASILIYIAYKKKIRESYIIFSTLALIVPTLSGTLSSIPRYALASFVIFPSLALIDNKILRYTILIIGLLVETILAAFFLRGYFVS